tara:strand:- start:2595 stop:2816 length:222 start_codon:yes stop_codon:yes gene_type:complete
MPVSTTHKRLRHLLQSRGYIIFSHRDQMTEFIGFYTQEMIPYREQLSITVGDPEKYFVRNSPVPVTTGEESAR